MTRDLVRRREQQCEATRRYRARHPDRVKAMNKRYYDENPERRKQQHNTWYQRVKGTPEFKEKANADARKGHARRNPKPGACNVCGGGGKICFDHCHQKRVFRGWLCNRCNLVLGHVRDNPELLRRLASYLEKE